VVRGREVNAEALGQRGKKREYRHKLYTTRRNDRSRVSHSNEGSRNNQKLELEEVQTKRSETMRKRTRYGFNEKAKGDTLGNYLKLGLDFGPQRKKEPGLKAFRSK